MAKPYKLTPIELALSPVEHFEDNLNKFINDENIADDKKLLLLQDALRRMDKHRPYRERPVASKQETSQDSAQSKEKELNSIVLKIGNLLPLSYREQSKRVLSYLMSESGDQVQVDSIGKRIIIRGKSYNLVDLICDMVTNRKGLLSFDDNLYTFLSVSNFPKSLIGNKQILKKLNEHPTTPFKKEEEEEDTSTTDFTTPVAASQKRRRIDSPSSVQKGSGHYTTCLRSKWMKF